MPLLSVNSRYIGLLLPAPPHVNQSEKMAVIPEINNTLRLTFIPPVK